MLSLRRTVGKAPYGRYQAKTFAVHSFRAATLVGSLALSAVDLWDRTAPQHTAYMQGWPPLLAMFGLIGAAAAGWGWQKRKSLGDLALDAGAKHQLRIKVGDFIDNLRGLPDAACAFGVNDRFSVAALMADSAHAHFLRAFFADSDQRENQKALDGALRASGLLPALVGVRDAPSGPVTASQERTQHPFGTVACVPFGQDSHGRPRNAFLLVNSTANRLGYSGEGSSSELLSRIWEYHEQQRHVTEEIVFTLIGNGGSRDSDPTTSARNIIDEYYRQLERSRKQGPYIKRVTISIHPRAVTNAEVDLEVVHNYAKARNSLHRALYGA